MTRYTNLRLATFISLALVLAAFSPVRTGSSQVPSRYLYVWAGSGNDTTPGVDV